MTYYVQILPYDTFGPGLPTQIAAFVPLGLDADDLDPDEVFITTTAQIANAIITDAHIVNLAVEKLLAGTILVRVDLSIGGGLGSNSSVFLDGVNHLITVYDTQIPQRARVWLGRLGAGGSEYGLMIWNTLGDLMWDFNSGASSLGIQDLAVTSAKIGTAQITSAHIGTAQITTAHIGDLQVDNAKIANLTVGTGKITPNAITESLAFASGTPITSTVSEVLASVLTLPLLEVGDQVLLWASGSGEVPPAPESNSMRLRIREDALTGAELSSATLGNGMTAPVFVQAIYTVVGAPVTGKQFVFSFQNLTGLNSVTLEQVRFTALVRKR